MQLVVNDNDQIVVNLTLYDVKRNALLSFCFVLPQSDVVHTIKDIDTIVFENNLKLKKALTI